MSVMKKLATTTNIPRNDEFKITDRASKLMQDVGSPSQLNKACVENSS